MKKQNIFPLVLVLAMLSGLATANVTISSLQPDDNWDTSDTTPRFCFVGVPANPNTFNTTLYINGNHSGTRLDAGNGTTVCITSNWTLNYASYSWLFNVTVGGANSNQTTARTIIISRFGSVTQTLEDTVPIFSSIVVFVVRVVPLIIMVVILGIILVMFSAVFSGIKGKIKKGF